MQIFWDFARLQHDNENSVVTFGSCVSHNSMLSLVPTVIVPDEVLGQKYHGYTGPMYTLFKPCFENRYTCKIKEERPVFTDSKHTSVGILCWLISAQN